MDLSVERARFLFSEAIGIVEERYGSGSAERNAELVAALLQTMAATDLAEVTRESAKMSARELAGIALASWNHDETDD